MRSMRQRLAAVTLIGGLTTLGLGLSAGPATAASFDTECPAYLGDAQSGSLHLDSSPAGGSTVEPGSTLRLTASWDGDDFDAADRLFVCGSVDGLYSTALSLVRVSQGPSSWLSRGTPNTIRSLTVETTVPADVPPGSDVCVIGALEGTGAAPDSTPLEMASETICFTAAAAPTTTTTAAPVEAVVEETGSGAGTTSAPAVEAAPLVEGEVAVNPAPAVELPRTGESLDLLAGFGAVAVALGAAARFTGRKRSAQR